MSAWVCTLLSASPLVILFLNVSSVSLDERSEAGNRFHVVGPLTVKLSWLYRLCVPTWNQLYTSLLPDDADRKCWRPCQVVTGCHVWYLWLVDIYMTPRRSMPLESVATKGSQAERYSSSPVLTATPHSYGKGQNSTLYKIKTPERIGMKFGTVDSVLEISP